MIYGELPKAGGFKLVNGAFSCFLVSFSENYERDVMTTKSIVVDSGSMNWDDPVLNMYCSLLLL